MKRVRSQIQAPRTLFLLFVLSLSRSFVLCSKNEPRGYARIERVEEISRRGFAEKVRYC